MKHFWIVDVVTAAGLISVIEKPWGDESLRGTVLWGTLGTGHLDVWAEQEWIVNHFKKYCGPDLSEQLQQ
jgi:hypothetical protein